MVSCRDCKHSYDQVVQPTRWSEAGFKRLSENKNIWEPLINDPWSNYWLAASYLDA